MGNLGGSGLLFFSSLLCVSHIGLIQQYCQTFWGGGFNQPMLCAACKHQVVLHDAAGHNTGDCCVWRSHRRRENCMAYGAIAYSARPRVSGSATQRCGVSLTP
ncbi:hypothetical protein COO60DRAFT_1475707 [Scenedesmus sp. NREL 46B-D3]|nr:hypothetical protein COO60DRAFT_1475707 [Scenedesmus sp. NREL 46B-D3]